MRRRAPALRALLLFGLLTWSAHTASEAPANLPSSEEDAQQQQQQQQQQADSGMGGMEEEEGSGMGMSMAGMDHMPTHAFIHSLQAQAYERHIAAVALAAAAPDAYAVQESRLLQVGAATARRATVSNIVTEIRITTSLDATVLALTAAQQLLVTQTVATAVLVLRKFYKVNQPLTSSLVVSPATDCQVSASMTYAVPAQLKNGTGQANTDLFIVVRANETDQCTNTVAWAFSCFFDTTTNRPIQGFVNVCPYFFIDSQFAPPLATRSATIVHEITHSLGFTSDFFFKVAGENTSGTDAYGDTVNFINSTRVAALTQSFFGCASVVGAQLEDQGGSGSANSHWDYRLFNGELMSPSGGYLLSNFTLSVMSDLGWYTPRFSFAAPFVRGRASGCGLLTQTCATVMSNSASQPYYCGTGSGSCVDMWDKAECSGNGFVFNKPSTCQVATNFGAYANDDCRSTTNPNAFDFVSSTSMCLTTVYNSATVGGCFDVACTAATPAGAGTMSLIAVPSGGGANISVSCPTGSSVDMSTVASAAYNKSTVVSCPNNTQICASLSCSPACNSTNGQCVSGNCVCYIEWLGVNCNMHVSQVVGTFDSYAPTLPPSPPPAASPPPSLVYPPPPPYAALDASQPQIQLTVKTTLHMNYTALLSSATSSVAASRSLLTVTILSLTTFQADFVNVVAALLKVPISSVNVTSVTGTDSLCYVIFTVLPGVTTSAAASTAILAFTTDTYAALGTSFDIKYSVTGATSLVTNSALVTITPYPPPSPPPTPSSPDKTTTYIIIGCCVGAAAIAVGIALTVCMCCRKKKNQVSDVTIIQVGKRQISSIGSPRPEVQMQMQQTYGAPHGGPPMMYAPQPQPYQGYAPPQAYGHPVYAQPGYQ